MFTENSDASLNRTTPLPPIGQQPEPDESLQSHVQSLEAKATVQPMKLPNCPIVLVMGTCHEYKSNMKHHWSNCDAILPIFGLIVANISKTLPPRPKNPQKHGCEYHYSNIHRMFSYKIL